MDTLSIEPQKDEKEENTINNLINDVLKNSLESLPIFEPNDITCLQIVLKKPTLGVLILPDGSYEFKELLQKYMLYPKNKSHQVLLAGANVIKQETKFIIQTREPTTVIQVCRLSLEATIERFTKIKEAYHQFCL